MTCPFAIQPALATDIPQLLAFVLHARRAMFPKLDDSAPPADLAQFEQHYLQGAGQFLLARDGERIIGCIGYLPYDRRFPAFAYPGLHVVEVVRLFVAPEYRRAGLASALCAALRGIAQAAGVQVLYLHTHPFLPGAVAFWQRQGFSLLAVDEDPLWQTTHLHQCLDASATEALTATLG